MDNLATLQLRPAGENESPEQAYPRILDNYQTLLTAYQQAKKAEAESIRLQPEAEETYENDLVRITEMALGQQDSQFDPTALNMLMSSMMHFAGELNACGVSIVYPKRSAPEQKQGYARRMLEAGKGLVAMLTGNKKTELVDDLAKYQWKEADVRFYDKIRAGVEVDIPDFEIDNIGFSHNIEILVLNEEGKERFGCDTFLRVGCAFDFLEGYMNHYSVKFNDGKFVSGAYGSEYAALLGQGNGLFNEFSSLQEFLQNLAENLYLPTERFLAYFKHPSLKAEMRQHVKELLEVKERYAPTSRPEHEEPDISQLFALLQRQLPGK